MRARRILAIAICGVYVAVLLVSGVFVFAHAEHDCAGEDCAICAAISYCERILRALSLFIVAMGLFTLCAAVVRAHCHIARSSVHPVTLVSLKVKLTN